METGNEHDQQQTAKWYASELGYKAGHKPKHCTRNRLRHKPGHHTETPRGQEWHPNQAAVSSKWKTLSLMLVGDNCSERANSWEDNQPETILLKRTTNRPSWNWDAIEQWTCYPSVSAAVLAGMQFVVDFHGVFIFVYKGRIVIACAEARMCLVGHSIGLFLHYVSLRF